MRKVVCMLLSCFVVMGLVLSAAKVSAAATTVDINSTASTDGYISKWGRPYPPQDHTDVSTSGSILVGQWRDRDTTEPGYLYGILRGYLSFDTSSIPDYAYIMSVKLKLKTWSDYSLTDFNLEIWGGQYGVHDIYGNSLTAGDWGCGEEKKAEWSTANCPGAGVYFEIPISDAHLNKTGVTQFELKSSREGTCPTGDEYMSFYSADSVGSEPKLEITYCEGDVPGGIIDEQFIKQEHTSVRVQLIHDGNEHMPDRDYYGVYMIVQNVWYIEKGDMSRQPCELQLTLEMPDWCQEIQHEPIAGDYGSSPVAFSVSAGYGGLGYSVSVRSPNYYVDYHTEVSNGKLKAFWNAKSFFTWAGIQFFWGELYKDTIKFFFEFEVPEYYKPTVAVNAKNAIYDQGWFDHYFRCWEDTGWLVVDPPEAPPIETDPAPPLSSPSTLKHPCSITSSRIYYNSAQQNLSSLIRGYSYYVEVKFSWLVDKTENSVLTVRIYDVGGNKIASASKQYNPASYGSYTATLTLNAASSAATGLGKLKLTMSSRDPETYESLDHAAEILKNVNVIASNSPSGIPSTPAGPSSGYVYSSYSYSTSAADPNGDSIRYEFNWGDGTTTTTGWYASGATASKSHYWSSQGVFYVTVRSQDPYGTWSSPSPSRTVSITGGGGGGCPYLYVWDGVAYTCEGLLDIHDPDGIDITRQHTLTADPQAVHGKYSFRLIEHSQTISMIDQAKLYAILHDGRLIELPLVYARHSEDGNILPQLLRSDNWKAENIGADHNNGVSQSIALEFAALPHGLHVAAFVFQIEGNNWIVKV